MRSYWVNLWASLWLPVSVNAAVEKQEISSLRLSNHAAIRFRWKKALWLGRNGKRSGMIQELKEPLYEIQVEWENTHLKGRMVSFCEG
jgi:hypothetical protein